ncbi:hypothetical protein DPMN_124989 [Dreissena polymorpha]|uniref:Uncharacterized protein n=1 Tax=Dreissena polymorpha TaxID=45954 RepID=A0A9D4JSN9_DREPO|nr:hypothetical protein DPMN_124989 [Dreissena polymorpha]
MHVAIGGESLAGVSLAEEFHEDSEESPSGKGNYPLEDHGITKSPEDGRGQRMWQRRGRAWRTVGSDTGQDFEGMTL